MPGREYMPAKRTPLGHFPCPVRAVSIYGGECRREYMVSATCGREEADLAIPCRRPSSCRDECSRDYMDLLDHPQVRILPTA